MTRKEAKEILENHPWKNEAMKMAIKALEQEPCEDCISRRELNNKIEMLDMRYGSDLRYGSDFYWGTKGIIDELPSVYPRQKVGHWETRNIFPNWLYCSECDEPYGGNDTPRYCPSCGAKMGEKE